MGRCNYKLYVENDYKQTGVFEFKEFGSNKYDIMAHSSTIDKFTTLYGNKTELLSEFNAKNKNHGVILDSDYGQIDIKSNRVLVFNKATSLNPISEPLYSCYKEITNIPVVNFTTCDINSPQFKQFFDQFISRLCHDNDFNYFYLSQSDYYPQEMKNMFIQIEQNIYRDKNISILRKRFEGYAYMRHAYKDLIDKRDMISRK